jgi:hypothetical protein
MSIIPNGVVFMVLISKQIQADDVSHLLLLNRWNMSVEPVLFTAELERFRPYQQHLASTVHHQELAFQELTTLCKGLKDLAGHGPGAQKWEKMRKKKERHGQEVFQGERWIYGSKRWSSICDLFVYPCHHLSFL